MLTGATIYCCCLLVCFIFLFYCLFLFSSFFFYFLRDSKQYDFYKYSKVRYYAAIIILVNLGKPSAVETDKLLVKLWVSLNFRLGFSLQGFCILYIILSKFLFKDVLEVIVNATSLIGGSHSILFNLTLKITLQLY